MKRFFTLTFIAISFNFYAQQGEKVEMYDADKIGGNAIFEDFDLDGDKDLLTL